MLEGQRIKVTILRSASSSGKLFCGQMKQNLQTWTVILWDQRKQGEANCKTQRDGLGPHFNSGVGTLVKIDGIYVTKKSSKNLKVF